ncbi:MAG TPA: nucleoside monophosphate kinase [Candidatus Tyrphobacter sp.]|nr:nucleoside monophosphate kinase [Candidatus Tyrphobacter sp.]
MRPRVIIIFGAPGAGKSLQAGRLANKFNFFHLEASRWFENLLRDPKSRTDPLLKKERKLYLEGELLTPSFVLRAIKKEIQKVARLGFDLILSGSPRTLYEEEGLMPFLEKLYGRRSISIILLDVPVAVSLKRNGARLICSVCGANPINFPPQNPCPICGGKLGERPLDKPEVIKIRLGEYEKRTKPIFEDLKKRGYKFIRIDGRPAPFMVFQTIAKKLGLK